VFTWLSAGPKRRRSALKENGPGHLSKKKKKKKKNERKEKMKRVKKEKNNDQSRGKFSFFP